MKTIRHGLCAAFCAILLALCGSAAMTSCSSDFWELSKYTVSYETDYGTAPSSVVLEYGTKLTAEHLPTLQASGHTFNGWYLSTDSAKTVIKDGDGHAVTGNITLVAKWDASAAVSASDRYTWLSVVPGDGTITFKFTASENTEFTTVAIHKTTAAGASTEILAILYVRDFASETANGKSVKTKSHTFSGLTNGTTYHFNVIAYKNSAETFRQQVTAAPGSSGSGTGALDILVR